MIRMNQYISVSGSQRNHREPYFPDREYDIASVGSFGFYTAEPIMATLDVPSFDNSAMDGYGFRFDDLKDSTKLKLPIQFLQEFQQMTLF